MRNQSIYSLFFVLFSVLFHLIVLWLISQQRVVRLPKPVKVNIIAAQLIMTPQRPLAVIANKIPLNITVDDTPLSAKQLLNNKETPAQQSPRVIAAKSLAEIVTAIELPPEQPRITIEQLYAASKHNIANRQRRLNQQSNQLQHQQQYGRQSSLSELVAKPPSHQYVASEITIEQRRKVMVYCDSTVRKLTVALGGLLQSSLECEKLPDLQYFIDQRRQGVALKIRTK